MARLSFVLAAVLCVTAVSAKCPNDVDWVERGVKICSKINCPAIPDCEKPEEDVSYDKKLDVTLFGCLVCKDKKQLRALSGSNDRDCPSDYPILKAKGNCEANNCELPPYCGLSMDIRFPKYEHRNGLRLLKCPKCHWQYKVKNGCPDNGYEYEKVLMSKDEKKEEKFQIGKRNGVLNTEVRGAAELAGYYCMPKQCSNVHSDCAAGARAGAEKVRTFLNAAPLVFKGCTHCGNKNAVDDPHWGAF